VARLAAANSRLLMDGGRLNTKSEAGYSACQIFLEGLDNVGRTLRLDPASRAYRSSFTINYRALFPDESRNYRVDVLEASIEQYAVIWVNGDKFEFSQEAMRRSEVLQKAWSELGTLLERWDGPKPSRSELRAVLQALDAAWASLESKYISELIEIEEKARSLIVQAIDHERALQLFELQEPIAGKAQKLGKEEATPGCEEEQRKLVADIARLNSVANFRRKGRDDLAVDVLNDAVATLRRCDEEEKRCSSMGSHRGSTSADARNAARLLASDVVESFGAMRSYLREVERCLERVDPHLCNNAGLVVRLVDWEESWEVGARYVQHPALLDAICDLVAEIRAAQRIAPALTQMCEDCDVELFMCLPRIVWLRFLTEPARHLELMKSLLPHRFPEKTDLAVLLGNTSDPTGGADKATAKAFIQPDAQADTMLGGMGAVAHKTFVDVELQAVVEKLRSTRTLLIGALPEGTLDGEQVAWEILVQRVVLGAAPATSGETEDPYMRVSPCRRDGAARAVDELMHDLERWSIELQRHCPEDWNQCSALLIQCLSGTAEKQRQGNFRV